MGNISARLSPDIPVAWECWSLTNELRWFNGVLQQKLISDSGYMQWDDVPRVTEGQPETRPVESLQRAVSEFYGPIEQTAQFNPLSHEQTK